jgi:hypothetical protein
MANFSGLGTQLGPSERPRWNACVEKLRDGNAGKRGRPRHWDDEAILRHVLHTLEARSGWVWPAKTGRPSGANCLRRLREWQRSGSWDAFLVELRRHRAESAKMAEVVSDEQLAQWESRALRCNKAHRRPSRAVRQQRATSDPTNPLVPSSPVHLLRKRHWWGSVVEVVRYGWGDWSKSEPLLLTIIAALARDRGWAWRGSPDRPGGRVCLRVLRSWKARATGPSRGVGPRTAWGQVVSLLREHLSWESGDIEKVWITEGLLDRSVAAASRVSAAPRVRPRRRMTTDPS